ncbi:MAG: hypothetical protein Q9184_006239 [Pyrenodesmia sp. 2 TL-2023]
MAKRAADTERVGYEDEFQSTAPSGEPQAQRATAAQLAARKTHIVYNFTPNSSIAWHPDAPCSHLPTAQNHVQPLREEIVE